MCNIVSNTGATRCNIATPCETYCEIILPNIVKLFCQILWNNFAKYLPNNLSLPRSTTVQNWGQKQSKESESNMFLKKKIQNCLSTNVLQIFRGKTRLCQWTNSSDKFGNIIKQTDLIIVSKRLFHTRLLHSIGNISSVSRMTLLRITSYGSTLRYDVKQLFSHTAYNRCPLDITCS